MKRYAGNFALVAGKDYSKRKSLPRDAHGFEPVEGYFNRRRDWLHCGHSVTAHFYHSPDSSDVSSLDEELIQREYERLKKKQGWSKKSRKLQPENSVPKDDAIRSPAAQSPPRRLTRSILRSSSTRYTETPQQTGLTPATGGPRGTVRSKLTWSDAKDPNTPVLGHQGTPATNTRSRQRSARCSLAVRNADEPVTDRETDKVSSDRENGESVIHSEGSLSPVRQSLAAVSENFNPMQASTANTHQTTSIIRE